ncbi:MAG: NUDIX domain-containing protein [Nanoarchaeota archaeon]|nr:NUDIX domain-containing protein [Nanoarchaeota archaeon]
MEVKEILREFEGLPKFEDGRIDYHNSKRAPVLICFVKFNDEILILKRSENVMVYKGKWNGVGGFLDEDKSVEEKVLEELKEELDIDKEVVKEIKVRDSYELFDEEIDRTWIIFPVLAELSEKPEIKLDREHTEYKWIRPSEIEEFDFIFKVDEILERALG